MDDRGRNPVCLAVSGARHLPRRAGNAIGVGVGGGERNDSRFRGLSPAGTCAAVLLVCPGGRSYTDAAPFIQGSRLRGGFETDGRSAYLQGLIQPSAPAAY